ncbi:MAG TPA: polysaccharide deacetylase family protein [Polyangiaceae bacterium]|nr:polysaccharide deacetylase family protein [Polyangiaceae bacterium]
MLTPGASRLSPGAKPSPARVAFLLATVGVGALLVLALYRALVGQSSFAAWSTLGLAVLGWVVLSTFGVFFPWLAMYGPVVSRGPRGLNRVALTFDDGPHPVTTRRVLELLRGTPHRATFFVLADKVARHPEVVREIFGDGHTIALHGAVHDRLHSFRGANRVERELRGARAELEALIGEQVRWFRPPLGHTSPATMRGVARVGLNVIGWSSRGYDGLERTSSREVLRRVLGTLNDGAIVLLHDAAERDDFEPKSLLILPELLAALDARGLRSVGLNTWLK